MMKFLKNNMVAGIVTTLLLSGIAYGAVIPGAMSIWRSKVIGHAAGATGSVLSAVTDTSATVTVTTGITGLSAASRITATTGGTATDIRAGTAVIAGINPDGVSISETLPTFTVNSATTVTGKKLFLKVNSITIPQHDGNGATTSFSTAGAPQETVTTTVMAALTDTGSDTTVTSTTSINHFDVPRNITAFADGTAGDIKAIQVTITGKNVEGVSIAETLPAFTVNTVGVVTGSKIFEKVTKIEIPAHDGTGATTSVGVGNKLGLGNRLTRNTVHEAYLGNTKEGTAPTVAIDADDIESNSAALNSNLDNTQVIIEYIETPSIQ